MIAKKTLLNALRSTKRNDTPQFVHFESKMYSMERIDDILLNYNSWIAHSENKEIYKFNTTISDLGQDVNRTHFVYEQPGVMSIFSFNSEYENTLPKIKQLNIKAKQENLECKVFEFVSKKELSHVM